MKNELAVGPIRREMTTNDGREEPHAKQYVQRFSEMSKAERIAYLKSPEWVNEVRRLKRETRRLRKIDRERAKAPRVPDVFEIVPPVGAGEMLTDFGGDG